MPKYANIKKIIKWFQYTPKNAKEKKGKIKKKYVKSVCNSIQFSKYEIYIWVQALLSYNYSMQ